MCAALGLQMRVTIAGTQHTSDVLPSQRGVCLSASGEALHEREAAAAANRHARQTWCQGFSPDPLPHMLRQVLPQHKLQPIAALGIQLVAHQPALLQLVQLLYCSVAAFLVNS